MPDPTIAVAMSGGVDSSVVAGMLHREGNRVVGLTMQLWNQRRLPELVPDGPTGRCCSLDDVYDARHVAQHLGIPYYVVNFENALRAPGGEAVYRRVSGRAYAHSVHAVQQLHQVRSVSRNGGRRRRGAHRHGTLCARHMERGKCPVGDAAQRGSHQGSDLFSVRPHPAAAFAHAVSPGWIRKGAGS